MSTLSASMTTPDRLGAQIDIKMDINNKILVFLLSRVSIIFELDIGLFRHEQDRRRPNFLANEQMGMMSWLFSFRLYSLLQEY
ncbi:hypothetical protein PALU110988_12650 [Paenibacillus lupini]|nr:hypothetical protein [Paenibacillus lupini]